MVAATDGNRYDESRGEAFVAMVQTGHLRNRAQKMQITRLQDAIKVSRIGGIDRR